jgi:hypothetical protein
VARLGVANRRSGDVIVAVHSFMHGCDRNVLLVRDSVPWSWKPTPNAGKTDM